jgi:hypothetical protein
MTMNISGFIAQGTVKFRRTAGILAIALLLPVFIVLDTYAADGEKISFGRFGEVTVYRQTQTPANVVLFVSGDGGWNSGVIDMAQSLVALDSVVIGIDIVHYLREVARSGESCTYSAADFENLSHYVQKKIALPHYIPPVLVGYSSGATLVYAVLVQAPTGTYKGALSMGFCPDLPLNKPFCPGSAGLQCQPGPHGKGYSFLPARQLKTKWIAFQGDIDQVCDPAATEKFVSQTSSAALVKLRRSVMDSPSRRTGCPSSNRPLPICLPGRRRRSRKLCCKTSPTCLCTRFLLLRDRWRHWPSSTPETEAGPALIRNWPMPCPRLACPW